MITVRISSVLFQEMVDDLRRPHAFAHERVGFMHCRASTLRDGKLLLAYKYEAIRDEQYLEDRTVGARFDGSCIREAMQMALSEGSSVFHVHLHEHRGRPRFSLIDRNEMQQIMPCFVPSFSARIRALLASGVSNYHLKAKVQTSCPSLDHK